jgi:hypothetical protein
MSGATGSELATYRLGGGRAVGWWIVGLLGLMAAAGLFTESGRNRLISVAFCVAVMAVAYLLGIRPCVMELPAELRICNPIRTVHIPWGSVDEVHVKDVVIVETAGRQVRCYGLPRRDRRSAAAAINASIGSRLPLADASTTASAPQLSASVVDRLRGHAEALGHTAADDGQIRFTLDRDVIAALVAVGVALVSVALLIWA